MLFSEVVRDVCALNPEVVFYAGRDRDLPVLVRALEGRGHCQRPVRPIVIATGATGLTITAAELDAAQAGVLDASSTDPAGWRSGGPGTPTYYPAFRAAFTGLGFTDDDLADGYAVMHRDAVATAVWAARRDAAAKAASNAARGDAAPIAETPTPRDVHNMLFSHPDNRIPAASGAIHFREQPPNDHWPSGKPVPVIRIGAVVGGWPAADPYPTR